MVVMVLPSEASAGKVSADVAGGCGVNGDFYPTPFYQSMTPTVNFGALMCSPILLERLGPNVLRSHVSTAHFKQIPNNDKVDLEAFRQKEAQEWGMDDVIAWMISVAREHHVPVEDMNMHRFANCSGPLLMLMNQQNFLDRDSVYGYLLYTEFRKLVGDDGSFLDDWMRVYKDEYGKSYGGNSASKAATISSTVCPQEDSEQAGPSSASSSLSTALSMDSGTTTSSTMKLDQKKQGSAFQLAAGRKNCASTKGQVAKLKRLAKNCPNNRGLSSSVSTSNATSVFESGSVTASEATSGDSESVTSKRNKDGRPRKRSQHNKGNKLWEFIRDALKDPSTCPSVVRWEDPKEGVFRIVESERLARLWGEKKNNQKMTYEKLSRAMRTYYEKQILVPVPKTGLYPKKLVYKFGPSAGGWNSTDVPSVKTEPMDESEHDLRVSIISEDDTDEFDELLSPAVDAPGSNSDGRDLESQGEPNNLPFRTSSSENPSASRF